MFEIAIQKNIIFLVWYCFHRRVCLCGLVMEVLLLLCWLRESYYDSSVDQRIFVFLV